LNIRRKILPPEHWQLGYTQGLLGNCLMKLHQFADAESMLFEGYAVLAAASSAQSSYPQQTLEWIVTLYERWGKSDKAAEYRANLATATTQSNLQRKEKRSE
jgi:hypothetical protein